MISVTLTQRARDPGATGEARPLPAPHTPPEPSAAHRTVSLHSKGNVRGSTLTSGPNPRRVAFESNLERKAIQFLLARPDVVAVHEQLEPVTFTDGLGRTQTRYLDLRATLADGSRVAVAVRPHERAARHDLEGELRVMAAQLDPSFADGIVHLSERHLPRDRVQDAELLHAVRRDNRPEDDRAVAAIVATLQGSTTVSDLVRASGLRGRGFRAVVRLIGDGVLRIVGPHGIGYATRVARIEGGR